MLLIMEAYSEYILRTNSETTKAIDKEVNLEYFRSEDTLFYKFLAECIVRTYCTSLLNNFTDASLFHREALFYLGHICAYIFVWKSERQK